MVKKVTCLASATLHQRLVWLATFHSLPLRATERDQSVIIAHRHRQTTLTGPLIAQHSRLARHSTQTDRLSLGRKTCPIKACLDGTSSDVVDLGSLTSGLITMQRARVSRPKGGSGEDCCYATAIQCTSSASRALNRKQAWKFAGPIKIPHLRWVSVADGTNVQQVGQLARTNNIARLNGTSPQIAQPFLDVKQRQEQSGTLVTCNRHLERERKRDR